MFKYGLGLLIGVLILGCSSKEQDRLMEIYAQKNESYKMLQKTEKLQLKKNGETTLLLTATYMNAMTIKNDNNTSEVFVIGMHSEDFDNELIFNKSLRISLQNAISKKAYNIRKKKEQRTNDLRLKVNQQKKGTLNYNYLKPISIESISHNHPLLKDIAFISVWSKFYLIKFKHVYSNRLTLKIQSPNKKTDFLHFSKVAKYAL